MKTINIKLEDEIYEELSEMLNAMGQTKQTFYESFTRTVLRERSMPFIISKLANTENVSELESSRKSFSDSIEYDVEREESMNEKYGRIDWYQRPA